MNRLRIVLFVLLAACSGQDDPKELAPGSEGGRCSDDGSCEPGLSCASDFCVRPPSTISNSATNNGTTTNNGATNNGATNNNTVTNNTNTTNNTTANSPPTCAIAMPGEGLSQPYTETWDLAATATDAEDGDLGANQTRWENAVAGALGNGPSLTGVDLSPLGTHVIRCVATDSIGAEGFSEVTVTVASPIAMITHPGGEDRSASEPMGIPFTGSGTDFEDRALTGASLVWSSDLEGEFGQGADFRAMLGVGQHTVTLTVTDSDGNAGTDTLTFNVLP